MDDKLDITLHIRLDRTGAERHLGRRIENDTAFYILGLVQAQLTNTFGNDHCLVELVAATGLDPAFIESMNSFARRYKRVLEALDKNGEAMVEDRDVLEVLEVLHDDVFIAPIGAKWQVSRFSPMAQLVPGQPTKTPKN